MVAPHLPTPTTDQDPRENDHRQPTTLFSDDLDVDSSTCSTPFVSAPSSPGRSNARLPFAGGFYYSAPASPMHFMLTTASGNSSVPESSPVSSTSSFEFDFSARLSTNGTESVGSMSSADELFLNGQIRPMKLSTHLQRPQVLAPLLDLDESGDQLVGYETATPSDSGASSRSSSAGRSSKRWVFLKEFLHRSKSEGRNNGQKFWGSLSLSPVKEKIKMDRFLSSKTPSNPSKEKSSTPIPPATPATSSEVMAEAKRKSMNVVRRRKGATPSAHELHYTAKRAEAEEMRKKTFLPYRQGLLGCLGFSSKSYGAMNGFARALNPVSSG